MRTLASTSMLAHSTHALHKVSYTYLKIRKRRSSVRIHKRSLNGFTFASLVPLLCCTKSIIATAHTLKVWSVPDQLRRQITDVKLNCVLCRDVVK